MKAIKKLIDIIAVWLFGPPCSYTYTCCEDAEEDEKERQGTRTDIKAILPESKKKQATE